MSNDVLYSNKRSLFTLKGQISVQFLDGQVLEGEFATQDAFNLFIRVDGEPVMIPRQQIRLIKGLRGQTIEPDGSQSELPEASAPAASPPPPAQPESGWEKVEEEDTGEYDGTLVIMPPDESMEIEEEDDDDGTLILVQEHEEDEDSQTMVLDSQDDFRAVDVDIPPVDMAATADQTEDDELDMTVVLGESDELPELDSTQPDDTQEPTAHLVCTGGPHAGQVFSLKSGINTIGRSSDNVVVLGNDKEISRHHAIILHESGKFVIQDQNSLNGTFVNDEQITGPRYLDNGDMVLVGVTTFEYQEE